MFIRYFFAVIASFSTSLTLLPSASANPTPNEVDDFVHIVNKGVDPLLYLDTEHLTSAQLLTFLSSVHSNSLNEANLSMRAAKPLRIAEQNVHVRQHPWKVGAGYLNETHMGQNYVYVTTEAGDCKFNFALSTTDPYLLRFAVTKCPQNRSAITGGIQLPSRSSEGPVVSFDEGRSYRFDVKTQKFVN